MTVTQEQINSLLDSADTREVVIFDKCLIVAYQFKNGFVMVESSACVDPANFDIEIGRKTCREHAENKLWELEGYLLQDKTYRKTIQGAEDDVKTRVEGLSPEAKDVYNTILETIMAKYPLPEAK